MGTWTAAVSRLGRPDVYLLGYTPTAIPATTPFHRTMIDALRPRVVVCIGNDAYGAVSGHRPSAPVVKIRHTSRSRRTWAEEQAPIVRAALDAAANGT